MKKIVLIILFSLFVFANSKLYFLPNEAGQAKSKIIKLIASSKRSIEISMYNFSYKKFAKELIKAQKEEL